MTEPLAFVMYEELYPGSQLPNRLRDLGYRVATLKCEDDVAGRVAAEKPLIAILDLSATRVDVCGLIRNLRETGSTAHLPVLAYAPQNDGALHVAGREAGAVLVASQEGLLEQLPALLEHALQVD